jgi:hypothetical protein
MLAAEYNAKVAEEAGKEGGGDDRQAVAKYFRRLKFWSPQVYLP